MRQLTNFEIYHVNGAFSFNPRDAFETISTSSTLFGVAGGIGSFFVQPDMLASGYFSKIAISTVCGYLPFRTISFFMGVGICSTLGAVVGAGIYIGESLYYQGIQN